MVEALRTPLVGVAVDVYHLWWDPALEQEIARTGRLGALLAYHVCDWRTPTTDLLLDRGLMGEGCIPLRQIRSWVEAAGISGFNEVEIFSNLLWATGRGGGRGGGGGAGGRGGGAAPPRGAAGGGRGL